MPEQLAEAWVTKTVTAVLLEDAHLGSGSGGGGLDALVARDRDGWPVIWSTHLEGLLRDAALRLHGAEITEGFFGRTGRRRPQRAMFTGVHAQAVPHTHVWRSTARAAFDNRAPKDDTLRAIEHVAKGATFTGLVQLPEGDVPFLARLLQEVQAVGRGRSSGAGRVRLRLGAAVARQPPAPGSATGRLTLRLVNLSPVCVTATATPDNVIPSLGFLPGRTMLGALAAWLIGEGRIDAARLLTDGRVSTSDALPAPHRPADDTTAEIIPAPRCLKSDKPVAADPSIPWWAQAAKTTDWLDARQPTAQGRRLKRPDEDLFLFREGPQAPWTSFRPRMTVRLRNGRPDPGQDDPQLFAIEQIAEQTSFLCDLSGAPAQMAVLTEALGPVLSGERWLRVGHGGAPVEIAAFHWCETASAAMAAGAASRAVITLTSDLLVRDPDLRWRTSLDGGMLEEIAGWPTDARLAPASPQGPTPIVQESVAVHGFNGTARLWRMPARAIRRGSVLEVEGPGLAALADMAARGEGLGERTHEGFGRFRLDAALPTPQDTPDAPVAGEETAEEQVARRTHGWFVAHRALGERAAQSERKPGLSQWLDLVAALERGEPNALEKRRNPTTAGGAAWRNADASAVLDELGAMDGPSRARHARLFVRWLRGANRREEAVQ